MSQILLKNRDLFVDFGIRKPHTVLLGGTRRVISVGDLRELRATNCRFYVEDGCPNYQLDGILADNEVFLVDGRAVQAAREGANVRKSDRTDAFIIRELVRGRPRSVRALTRQDATDLEDRRSYGYYCRVTDLVASLKNRQEAFRVEFGETLPQLDSVLVELEREKRRAAKCFKKFEGPLET